MASLLARCEAAFPWRGAALVLALAALVLGGAAALRSAEYDENYSVFVTGGVPRPDWPRAPFRPSEAVEPFMASTGPAEIARLLRETDVHPPPLYGVHPVKRVPPFSAASPRRTDRDRLAALCAAFAAPPCIRSARAGA